ncbi:hypothetical protein [uncultured Sphingomonas sp.]|uniref:hypothetical protein n=1 Tax=uncultured Sphingomonas sp. TaxID=158754 RepID=UPI0035CC7DDC
MSWAERMMQRGRDMLLLSDKVGRLDHSVQRLDALADDHEARIVRLETTVQLLGGITLPPIATPRLPRQ